MTETFEPLSEYGQFAQRYKGKRFVSKKSKLTFYTFEAYILCNQKQVTAEDYFQMTDKPGWVDGKYTHTI